MVVKGESRSASCPQAERRAPESSDIDDGRPNWDEAERSLSHDGWIVRRGKEGAIRCK